VKLGLNFSLTVLLVLAVTLGGAAWGVTRLQEQNRFDPALQRAELVRNFAESRPSPASSGNKNNQGEAVSRSSP
jgi:hypothetical protein